MAVPRLFAKTGPCFLYLSCTIWSTALFSGSAGAQLPTAPAPTEEARSAALDRMLNLKNLDVEFNESVDYTPSAKWIELAKSLKLKERPYQGHYEYRNRFRFLEGRAFFERRTTTETLASEHAGTGAEEPTQVIFVSAPERYETFTRYEGVPLTGQIGDPSDLELPQNWLIDVALGLRGRAPHSMWLDKAALKSADVLADPDSPQDMIVKIRVGPAGRLLDSWWCKRTADGVSITKYTLSSATQSGQLYMQIDCNDFQRFGGLSLPTKITVKTYSSIPKGSAPYVGETARLEVVKYVVNGKDNTPESYVMVWPKATNVFDKRTRESFIIRDSPRTLDDDYISGTLEKNLRKTQDRLNSIATQPSPTTGP